MHLTVIELLDNPSYTSVWENQSPAIFTTKAAILRQQVAALTTTIARQEAKAAEIDLSLSPPGAACATPPSLPKPPS